MNGRREGRRFPTTEWALVAQARTEGEPACREAMDELCRAYWFPVYGFVRKRCHDATRAEDLTQEFFGRLIEMHWLDAVDPRRGRFRSFLLAAVRNFLANEWDRQRALRRGGSRVSDQPDAVLDLHPAAGPTPEADFEKRWALAVLNRTRERLRSEITSEGDVTRFTLLYRLIVGESGLAYRDVARSLGMTENAVKVAIHRLRKRYAQLLRIEVNRTRANPSDVDDEIRYLFSLLSRA